MVHGIGMRRGAGFGTCGQAVQAPRPREGERPGHQVLSEDQTDFRPDAIDIPGAPATAGSIRSRWSAGHSGWPAPRPLPQSALQPLLSSTWLHPRRRNAHDTSYDDCANCGLEGGRPCAPLNGEAPLVTRDQPSPLTLWRILQAQPQAWQGSPRGPYRATPHDSLVEGESLCIYSSGEFGAGRLCHRGARGPRCCRGPAAEPRSMFAHGEFAAISIAW